jgi:uncharacterized GH25 family protein
MRKVSILLAATVLMAGLIAVSSAQAHGIWFAQRASQLALVYGLGADDLDPVKRLPDVQSITGYDSDWSEVPTELRVAGPLVVVDSDYQPAVVAAVLDYGIWTKAPDGLWYRKPKDEVPNSIVSSRSFKYGVHITEPLKSPMPALEGHMLQITPVGIDIPELLGEPLTLRVLYKGKPVAGAEVKADFVNDVDAEPLITADDGTVTIVVRNQGLNVVSANFEAPSEQPTKFDREKHLATLSFVLPHLPE